MVEPSLARAAGQVLVAGFGAGAPPAGLVDATRRGELGGIVLFKRNVGEMADVARLIAALASAAPADAPLLVAIDQEGGRVARLGAPVVKLPPMRTLAMLHDPALTRRAGAVLGAQLRALGITMDFAPVLDVDTNPANPVIGDRSFSRDPAEVIVQALAFAEGLESAGVLSCGKHFPGHGDTEVDSHLALPRVSHSRARLDAIELAPFRAARGKLSSLMTAHVVFDALDPEVPATLSHHIVTDVLRGELGYQGVVFSDDLEMKALADRMSAGEAAVRAIAAGCDAVLVCSEPELVDEARAELAERATHDDELRARLLHAAESFVAMRRRAPPSPIVDAVRLSAALEASGARALEDELARRAG